MARCSALAGSLVIHGAIALGFGALALHGQLDRTAAPPEDVAIELVAPLAPPAVPPLPTQVGGGSPGSSPAPPRTPRHARAPRTAAATARAAAPATRAAETTMRIEAPNGVTSPNEASNGFGGFGGDGGDASDGGGHGGGRGIGFGAGGRIDTPIALGPLPVPTPERARAPSRARPPRLIYPARDREAEESLLFVARLTIDPEGFVVGARLVRGVGGVRDDQASSAVWRFRYSPALDDAGRPTQATIEQRFLVE